MTSTIANLGERIRSFTVGSLTVGNGEAVPPPTHNRQPTFEKLHQRPAVVAPDAQARAWETSGTPESTGEGHAHGAREQSRAPFISRFNGSKGGAGVWQRIISEMPPHSLYVEAFAGTGQVLLKKRPAVTSIAIDSDKATCAALSCRLDTTGDAAGVLVICDDAVSWLETYRGEFNQRTVVYCDPPYLYETRTAGRRKYYNREKGETWGHKPLLDVLSRMAAQEVNILISGYRSDLYDAALKHWRRIDYTATTRGGAVTECLWCSFDPPAQLHDYRFLGADFRERERLKRKKARWLGKLRRMAPIEAAAILSAIDEWRGECI
jgi:DNA adenine methylase